MHALYRRQKSTLNNSITIESNMTPIKQSSSLKIISISTTNPFGSMLCEMKLFNNMECEVDCGVAFERVWGVHLCLLGGRTIAPF